MNDMAGIQGEARRLAYLKAMGVIQWEPRAGQSESHADGMDAAKDKTAAEPVRTPSRHDNEAQIRPAKQDVIQLSVVGTPNRWLWLVANQQEQQQELLSKIQQASGIDAPGYVAWAGADEPASEVLEPVEVVVAFGQSALAASQLAKLDGFSNKQLILTVSLEELGHNRDAKRKLWAELQRLGQ